MLCAGEGREEGGAVVVGLLTYVTYDFERNKEIQLLVFRVPATLSVAHEDDAHGIALIRGHEVLDDLA